MRSEVGRREGISGVGIEDGGGAEALAGEVVAAARDGEKGGEGDGGEKGSPGS